MLTIKLNIKLNIKSCSDFDYIYQNQKKYSHAFRILYKYYYNISNPEFIDSISNKLGIIKVEINPVYTSFIGNLLRDNIVPINASIEIGRREIYKYIKNTGFYPEIDMGIILDTMKRLNRDVLLIKDQGSWNNLYRLIKTTRLRYRANLDDCNRLFRLVHNMGHSKIRNYQLTT